MLFIVLCEKCVIELQLPIKALFQKKKETWKVFFFVAG